MKYDFGLRSYFCDKLGLISTTRKDDFNIVEDDLAALLKVKEYEFAEFPSQEAQDEKMLQMVAFLGNPISLFDTHADGIRLEFTLDRPF